MLPQTLDAEINPLCNDPRAAYFGIGSDEVQKREVEMGSHVGRTHVCATCRKFLPLIRPNNDSPHLVGALRINIRVNGAHVCAPYEG